jgi:type VI secretion system ImpM family protein
MHPTIGTFGKLRGQGDFLQAGHAGPIVQELRQWVESGLGRAVGRSQFVEAFDDGVAFGFLFRSPKVQSGALVGILAPSKDAVGRRFPLVAFAELDPEPLYSFPHLAPLVLGDFLERVRGIVVDAVSHGSSATFLNQLGSLVAPQPAADVLAEAQSYTRWAQQATVEGAFAWVYERASSEELARVFGFVRSATSDSSGQAAPSTPVALRLPLGAAGAGGAALWLDLVRRIAEWSQMVPTCFWSVDPRHSELVVQLGVAPPATFGELWLPRADSDHVCDLTVPSKVRPVGTFDHPALENPASPVFELLCSL